MIDTSTEHYLLFIIGLDLATPMPMRPLKLIYHCCKYDHQEPIITDILHHESLQVLDSPVLLLAGQATHGVVVEAGGQKLNVVTMLVSTS